MINPNFSAKSIENYLGMVSDREFFQEFKHNAINLGVPSELSQTHVEQSDQQSD